MPRLPGGAATNLPGCPRPGHQARRVVKDGHYGTPPRQRYRCIDPAGGFHRFTPPLPREMTRPGVCDDCDNAVAAHQGPALPRAYHLPVREVAAAFIAVGSGATYTRAAARARAASGRRELQPETGGQLVAEWLDALAPAVLAAHAEQSWPQAVVLDSTNFFTINRRTRERQQAFAVLGAYGYPARGGGRRRLWALRAYPRATAAEWEDFLRQLDTTEPPAVVVSDGAGAIAQAVRAVWPALPGPSLPQPFLFRCEWHLRRNARTAMDAHRMGGHGSFHGRRLGTAFLRPEGWEEFARVTEDFGRVRAWVRANDAHLRVQVGVRGVLPGPRTTAALDTPLRRVRDFIDSRTFVLRNARRTNLMLGLVRLHLNDADHEHAYRRVLREVGAGLGEHPGQRQGYDQRGQPSLRT